MYVSADPGMVHEVVVEDERRVVVSVIYTSTDMWKRDALAVAMTSKSGRETDGYTEHDAHGMHVIADGCNY